MATNVGGRLVDEEAEAARLPLELCNGSTPECPHYACPDGWHPGDYPNCSCTPDCARARTAVVRYRVCAYATVDLVSGAVSRVVVDDESIRLDFQPAAGVSAAEPVNDAALVGVVEVDNDNDGEFSVGAEEITPALARRVVDIAESAMWPGWDIGA